MIKSSIVNPWSGSKLRHVLELQENISIINSFEALVIQNNSF